MKEENETMVTFFILKGISDVPEEQSQIFIIILFIYMFTLAGNMTVLLLVCTDSQLHTPMYFFLGNLSLIDMISTNVTLFKIFSSFITRDNTISFQACAAQMSIYSSLTDADMFMLTSMSYDRYVAICNPLRYPMVMSYTVCVLLAFFSWFLGVINTMIFIIFFFRISCYRSNIVNHFFCDLVPFIELSCSDTSTLETLILIQGIPVSLIPFSVTLTSYILIIDTILKIHSSTGRRKAFYTCSSHLTVVSLFYVTICFVYFTPSTNDRIAFKKIASLCNTVAVPLLNPLIYSLKNKDMKSAFSRQLQHCNIQ